VAKPYKVTLELWDADNPEEIEKTTFDLNMLTNINDRWAAWVADRGIPWPLNKTMKGVNIGSLRVSMSRNNGKGVAVNELEAGGKLYKVRTTVRRPLQTINVTDEMWDAGTKALQRAVDEDQDDLALAVQQIFSAMMRAQ